MSAEGSRGRRVLLGLLLFAASAAYFGSYARYGLYDDEGYLLEGVTRILDGQVIYRDFHHTYAPGRFYLFAALFRIFGEDLLVVRATWVVMRAAVVVMAWLVARRFVAGPLALAPALGLLAAPGPWHKSFFHFFLLATLAAGIGLVEKGGARRSFATGALVGLALLFRQDVGIAAAGAIVVALAARAWGARAGVASQAGDAGVGAEAARAAAASSAPVSLPLLVAGAVAVLAIPLAYFASERALGPLAEKVLLAGARDNRANALPFPPLLPLVPAGAPGAAAPLALLFVKALYYLPLVTFAALALAIAARAARRREMPEPSSVLLVLIGGSALVQVAARSDFSHLFQAIGLVYVPWAMAAAAVVEGLAAPGAAARRAAAVALTLAFPLLLTAGLLLFARAAATPDGAAWFVRSGVTLPPENASGARVSLAPGPRVALGVPRGRVLVSPEEAAFVEAIGRFLEQRTRPRDYVLTVPGFQLIYFLFDRRNPTPFPHVRRAFDSPEEEEAYIASIDAHRTPLIFFEDFAIDGRPERRFAVYAKRTMDWIVEHYQPGTRIGRTLVLERIAKGA